MVCTACGHVGADVRPDWSQTRPAAKPDRAISVESKPGWSAELTRRLMVRGGPTLMTLEDACRFIAGMPKSDQHRQAWIRVTEVLMAAAERGGSIHVATDAVDAAFLQGKLEL